MNHDDTSQKSVPDRSSQMKKSATSQPSNRSELAIQRAELTPSPLAVKQEFESRQVSVEEARVLNPPMLDNFLPTTHRLLMLGGIGVLAALGLGAIALVILPYQTTIKAIATVAPIDDVKIIKSGVGGTLQNIYVEEYEVVESGQEIAIFDNPALRKDLTNVQSQIDQLQSQIVQVDNELISLRQRRGQSISGKQFRHSERLLVEHLRDLDNQLNQRRSRLEQVQQQLERTTARAPVAGTLYGLELNVVGQSIEANRTIARLLPENAAMEIQALIPHGDINNIEVGYPTRISFHHCKASRFRGFKGIINTVEAADLTPENDHYKVTVATNVEKEQSETTSCQLLPGAEGELTIIAKQGKLLDFFLRKLRFKTNI